MNAFCLLNDSGDLYVVVDLFEGYSYFFCRVVYMYISDQDSNVCVRVPFSHCVVGGRMGIRLVRRAEFVGGQCIGGSNKWRASSRGTVRLGHLGLI